jgi:hypothetical protein
VPLPDRSRFLSQVYWYADVYNPVLVGASDAADVSCHDRGLLRAQRRSCGWPVFVAVVPWITCFRNVFDGLSPVDPRKDPRIAGKPELTLFIGRVQ